MASNNLDVAATNSRETVEMLVAGFDQSYSDRLFSANSLKVSVDDSIQQLKAKFIELHEKGHRGELTQTNLASVNEIKKTLEILVSTWVDCQCSDLKKIDELNKSMNHHNIVPQQRESRIANLKNTTQLIMVGAETTPFNFDSFVNSPMSTDS